MEIEVRGAQYRDVEAMRDLYRQELNCQIVHDSALARGLADPYLIFVREQLRGYGAVWNRYYEDQVVEFYTLPDARGQALPMFRALLDSSSATHIEAQTNNPLMLMMLYDCAKNITTEKILFEDTFTSHLNCPNGNFRRVTPADIDSTFAQEHEPAGDYILEVDGAVVATGGFLCHYNPPYGDIYMEVVESARRQGYGSYLVQELKRTCYEAGKKPSARCDPTNVASRLTLQKAGMLPCGRLLMGEVDAQA